MRLASWTMRRNVIAGKRKRRRLRKRPMRSAIRTMRRPMTSE
jgi:hypothetical protein